MDIEELKNITGMNDAELTSYILDRYNAGATNEEIMDELTSKEIEPIKETEREDRPESWDSPWEMYFTEETKTRPNWRSHTMHEGNSTPDDNGWTDLKKLGLSIGRGLKKPFTPNKAIDPLWQLGVIEDAFGDDSKLKMWNQNVESRNQREAQYEYNKMLKAMDEAQQEKEKSVAATKAASDERIAQLKAQKETYEKNRETFLNIINDMNNKGKALTDTEKAILKVQYDRLNETDKNEYQSVYNKLYGDGGDGDGGGAPPFGTQGEQEKHKNYVVTERSEIKGMKNGTEKQTRMENLNDYISKHGSSVKDGLGDLYTPEEIKAAGPKKVYSVGYKWYGKYRDIPRLASNLKWKITNETNDKGEPGYVVVEKER